ncbi:MAG: hypothetical protein U0787_17245 [Polyangia bacterium]
MPGTWRALPQNPWLDGWLRWDAGWYYELATQGHDRTVTAGQQSNTAFSLSCRWSRAWLLC